jgi:hypothetical protein
MVDLSPSVPMPGPDDAQVREGVVAHGWFVVVQIPIFAEDPDEVATLVHADL